MLVANHDVGSELWSDEQNYRESV